MKWIWLTDIHLNLLEINERKKFYQDLIHSNGDLIFITGDIAEAPSVSNLLKEMAAEVRKPIYFVLGNHDYYHSEVSAVRNEMAKLTHSEIDLKWLSACEPIELEKGVILIGEDGWADGRYGDYINSTIRLSDERMIPDLYQAAMIGKERLLKKMQEFADFDAKQLEEKLNQTISQYHPKKIIVLTHIPPFKEACKHKGESIQKDWAPYFASKAMGDVLMKCAKEKTETEFLVLCGHTHSLAEYKPLENLIIKVGKAEYHYPEIQAEV